MKWICVPPNLIQSGPCNNLPVTMKTLDIQNLRIVKAGTSDKELLSHLPTIMLEDPGSRHRWAQIEEDNLRPKIDYSMEAFWICKFVVPTYLVGKQPPGIGDRVMRWIRINHGMMSHIRRLEMYRTPHFINVNLVRVHEGKYTTNHTIEKL